MKDTKDVLNDKILLLLTNDPEGWVYVWCSSISDFLHKKSGLKMWIYSTRTVKLREPEVMELRSDVVRKVNEMVKRCKDNSIAQASRDLGSTLDKALSQVGLTVGSVEAMEPIEKVKSMLSLVKSIPYRIYYIIVHGKKAPGNDQE